MIKTAMSFEEIKELINKDYKIIQKFPYLNPILSLNSVNDNYFMDSGKSICLYFLSNSSG